MTLAEDLLPGDGALLLRLQLEAAARLRVPLALHRGSEDLYAGLTTRLEERSTDFEERLIVFQKRILQTIVR